MPIEVVLPTLHADQVQAFRLTQKHKLVAVRCGRRWGKSALGRTIACDAATKGEPVGWFAPHYKFLAEMFNEIAADLRPVRASSSRVEGVIRTISGGRIDFWSLENESAGRSRHYKKVIIDEAAFAKENMMEIWEQAIKPTLFDYDGSALALSNTRGNDPKNFMWRICNEPEHGFREYHAPTMNNPLLPFRRVGESDADYALRRIEAHEKLRRDNHPLVYQQEYLAEFVDWSGVAFFSLDKLLVNDAPVEMPPHCDAVFAIIDTAIKAGSKNDGTGIIYFARSKFTGHPLILLDYDIVQIEGASLEHWIPSVFANLEALSKRCKARMGSIGAFIEDTNSGTILLQQAARRGWPAQAIESALTAKGKDERAINASPFVYRGEVKVCREAYDKVMTFKGTTRNHMMSQILGFRVGDKDAARRADDLLDCFTYGIALALGSGEGI